MHNIMACSETVNCTKGMQDLMDCLYPQGKVTVGMPKSSYNYPNAANDVGC